MNTRPICCCIFCKKEIPSKGIHTHVDRTHLKLQQYSSGHHGRYHEIQFKQNLVAAKDKTLIEKHGVLREYIISCSKCFGKFSIWEREKLFPSKKKYFCSRQCANSRSITEKHRKKISESMTGKPYSIPVETETICEYCNTRFYQLVHRTKQKKKCCSRSCSTKLQAPVRYKHVRERRPGFINYRADTAFKFNLKDYPDEFNFTLVEQYGWYSPKNKGNNLSGVSRDHMVSVRYGFDHNIDPAIIAHPANCRLILQSQNASKNKKNEITYEELLVRIARWNNKYPPK